MRDAYEELSEYMQRIYAVSDAQTVLNWDQEVMMPDGGVTARSQQLSTLQWMRHRLLRSDQLGGLLDACDAADLSPAQAAAVREVRWEHDRAVPVEPGLLEEMTAAKSRAVETWRDAREEDDFDRFAPHLQEIVALKREYANQVDPDREPYAVLYEDFEPHVPFTVMEQMLDRLRTALPDLVDTVAASDVTLATDTFRGTFAADEQETLAHDLVRQLGFDFDRGRFDTSSHPVTLGNQFDTRLTTRFDTDHLLPAITATVHECGHALYNQGVPQDRYGSPLGAPLDLGMHESQSRLWENHVARSQPFWEYLMPTLQEEFPDQFGDVTPQTCFAAANQVYDDNLIRIQADELTYHLHILVRFDLERQLINGDITVDELPMLWNDKMAEYLGVRPETDRDGVLQDIHWAWGAFGYFPTYTLGTMIAAQLYDTLEQDVTDVDALIRDGDFAPIRSWLRDEVHQHGRRYETPELVEQITGEPPTADYFLTYAEDKFGELYNL